VTRRRKVIIGVVAALVLLSVLGQLRKNQHPFVLKAEFADASGLRKDFFVRVDGVAVGKVTGVTLSKSDTAIVSMQIDKSALPIGRDARATIRPSSLLGEHHVDVNRGSADHPAPSGTLLPLARTSTAIELDQVLAGLDEPARAALKIFLSESGDALVGRGHDLGATLRGLPPTLDQATTLLSDLGQDNSALGRLIRDSDTVVAPLARRRKSLGRFVQTANLALSAIANRRDDLGAGIAGGPAAVVQLRDTLRRVRSLSHSLRPAADGLRASALPLRTTMEGLVPFAKAARPALKELRRTAPKIGQFTRRADPVVVALQPTVKRLNEVGRTFEPVSRMLERQTPNLLAFFEGYARLMHISDLLGHIYHVETVYENIGDAAQTMSVNRRAKRKRGSQHRLGKKGAGAPSAPDRSHTQGGSRPEPLRIPGLPPLPGLPKTPKLPSAPGVKAPGGVDPPGDSLLDYLLKP
jgi:phospholipid/cholesterol/gamma-HCH transport system substrate-binding protein